MAKDKFTKSVQETFNELLGITYWRRHWGLVAGILCLPFAFVAGIITGGYPFDRSQIQPTSQMLVELSSFLSAAWTFGFAYLWPGTQKAIRQMRKSIIKLKPVPEGFAVIDALKHLRMPFWTSLIAIFGLVLMICSAFLAIGAMLFGFTIFILFALWSLALGSALMIGTWVQLYVAGESLGNFAELIQQDHQAVISH